MKLHKNISYTLILGSIFIFIWFKFIRERLPQDIPFTLSLLKTFFLIFMCICLIFLLSQYIYSTNKENISTITAILYKPFQTFDSSIKKQKYIRYYYEKVLIFFIHSNVFTIKRIVFFEYMLRIIIIIIFLIDIFLFKQLYLTYKIIYLFLYTYTIKYLIYSLKNTMSEEIMFIDVRFEIRFNNIIGPIILLNNFIENQTTKKINKEKLFVYELWPRSDFFVEEIKALKLKENQTVNYKKICASGKRTINLILALNEALKKYHIEKKRRKYLDILLLSIYLFSWLYILRISLHTFNITLYELYFLKNFQDHNNPFL